MNSETPVHISARYFLKANGWTLIAGQFPGGSDDEVPTLYIVDPIVARDNSPDHRRHSLGKFVPDIVAIKDNRILIVEAKPSYSAMDKMKLDDLLENHRADYEKAISDFQTRNLQPVDLLSLKPVPCLAFNRPSEGFPVSDNYVYLITEELKSARWYSRTEVV